MSELRIALVAEGPTDHIVIAAALKAMLSGPFVLILLQPEATRPRMGTGWCGVLKWCQETGKRHQGCLDNDPTLLNFDLVIIHLDADVADKSYRDCSPAIADRARQYRWQTLPCSQPCPPAADTCARLEQAIADWLGEAEAGRKTLLCLPSKSIGTWLAAAVLPEKHSLLASAECDMRLESKLGSLPQSQRIRKTQRAFREREATITQRWKKVTHLCGQAAEFERQFQQKIRRFFE